MTIHGSSRGTRIVIGAHTQVYDFVVIRPVGGEPGRYDVLAGRSHPVRFVCLGCGRTLEADGVGLRRERDRLARQLGFRPLHHHMEIFGTCRDCAPGTPSARRR